MYHYRTLRLSGMEKLRNTHEEFQYLQEKYYIPRDFCMPADFFREEQLDFNVAYHKRCCSVYDFYNMLSRIVQASWTRKHDALTRNNPGQAKPLSR